MMRPLLTLLFALVAIGPARAQSWTLDSDHTEVRFTWDHLGVSRQGGRFRDVSGKVVFDPANLEASSVEVTIPLAGILTGIAKLDEHLLKTKDFFDATAYPNITFNSTSVKAKSDRTLDVTGDLTINGITNPVTLDCVWNFTGDHPMAGINPNYVGQQATGFSATTQIRRSDWGIKRTIPYVSDEIKISIETEMTRMAPPADATVAAPSGVGSSGGGSPSGLSGALERLLDDKVHNTP